VTTMQPSFAAFRIPVDRKVFAPGFVTWLRIGRPFRRLWLTAVRLPDRGGAEPPDDLPPEFFRYPPF
jgi:hypothetical protein